MSQFGQPGIGGDKFVAAEHNGMLLLFFPTEFKSQVPTVNGATDAVGTKIVNLDNGVVLNDTMVFGSALVPQLKGAVAEQGMVLGRLGQGQAKGGNNPPWLLAPHEAQDVAKAEAYLAANPRNQFGNGQAPPTPAAYAAPATNGWGAGTQGAVAAPVAPAAAGTPDPTLVMKLVNAGAPVQPGMTQDQLLQVAALLGIAV